MRSKAKAYQRFISHQDELSQRKRKATVKSFSGRRDVSKLTPEATPILNRRGGRKVVQCRSYRLVQQSRNVEV